MWDVKIQARINNINFDGIWVLVGAFCKRTEKHIPKKDAQCCPFRVRTTTEFGYYVEHSASEQKTHPPNMCIVLPFQGKNYGGIWVLFGPIGKRPQKHISKKCAQCCPFRVRTTAELEPVRRTLVWACCLSSRGNQEHSTLEHSASEQKNTSKKKMPSAALSG